MGSFSSVIGQRTAKSRIRPLLLGNPEQAYLITGPEGIGKRLFAAAMAKALLCEAPNEDGGCGTCGPCRYFAEKTHPDFIHLSPQSGEKMIRVASIRERVVRDIFMFPQISNRKIYLIEADYLNEEGQNALLKTLEEPPAKAILILTAADTDRLLDTVVSRSVRISLTPNTEREIIKILKNVKNTDEKDALPIASLSKGIPGLALKMADDESLSEIIEKIAELLNALPHISLSELLTGQFSFFDKNKDRINEVFAVMQMGLGDIALLITDQATAFLRVIDKRDNMIRMIERKKINVKSVDRASVHLAEASRAIRSNYSFETSICSMLLSIRKEFCND